MKAADALRLVDFYSKELEIEDYYHTSNTRVRLRVCV